MLSFEHIHMRYGARNILKDISFTVRPGEVVALIGPNGAGKSTLIRAASGTLAPARGRVTIDGEALLRLPPGLRAQRVAVVPQAARLPETFTAFDTVLMGRTAYLGWLGRESAADRQIARAALERTETLDLAERPIGELSGGEQQRVLIARALAQAAPVLLLDEPTAHLDLKHQSGILALVRDLAHAGGHAVLVALHDLNLAAQFGDRVALLAGGELRALGRPDEVLTAAKISHAYGVPVDVTVHPRWGTPLVFGILGG